MEYLVTGNIQHDGRPYVDGDTIDFSEEQAAPLIEAGVMRDPTSKEESIEAPKARSTRKSRGSKGNEPEVGGNVISSGEPSTDGPAEDTKSDAVDITPEIASANDPSADL